MSAASGRAPHRSLQLAIFNNSHRILGTLELWFRAQGHVVHTAAPCEFREPIEDVCRVIQEAKADVVVYDIGVPYGSSWDLLNLIRSRCGFRRRFVVTTAINPASLDLAVGDQTGAFELTGTRQNLRALWQIVCNSSRRSPGRTAGNVSSVSAVKSNREIQQWLDLSAGLAYISVGVRLNVFQEFLDSIDTLLSHPEWRPGTPIVEDLRRCRWVPPSPALEEWRTYMVRRHQQLKGCRWAVVTTEDSSSLRSILDAAAQDAAPSGVTLKQFTNMLDAHLWVKPPSSRSPVEQL